MNYTIGEIEGEHLPQKFVVSKTDDGFVFYAMSYWNKLRHREIANRFGLKHVYGGGWVSDRVNKIIVGSDSGDFGAVPKEILERFGLKERYEMLYSGKTVIFEPKGQIKDHWKKYLENPIKTPCSQKKRK